MLPTISPGDVLTVQGVSADEISPGEIVILNAGTEWWAHRILRLSRHPNGLTVLTKGDNRISCDPLWENLDNLAVVTAIRRGDHQIDTSRRSIKICARFIAMISYLQAITASSANTLIRRIGYAATSSLIVFLSKLSYRVG